LSTILLKGLKHIPPPHDLSDKELEEAIDRLHHQTLWKYYHFLRRPVNEEEDDDTIARDRYIPTKYNGFTPCNFIGENNLIVHSLNNIRAGIEEYKESTMPPRKSRSNEIKLLRSLLTDYPEIIFKATDKNLGLAALTLTQYDSICMEHLSNPVNYRLAAEDHFSKIRLQRMIMMKYDVLTKYTSQGDPYPFAKHEQVFLSKQGDFTLPKFHCLPKLHKRGPLKGRPIAGAVNWITTPISRILDLRLQTHLHQEEFSCILKNSKQLVDELELGNSFLPTNLNNFYLITGDVQSLYPNIDIARLLEIIEEVDFTLVPLVDFVCNNSYVEYAGRIYKQLNGIAMGTNAAVSLANIYMAKLIDRYIRSRPQVFYYKRYIDDLFIIWNGSLEMWDRVQTNVNRIHPKIHIDFSTPSLRKVDFLDITVSMCPWKLQLETSIYQKALNKYLYITPESTHVPHMFSGFITGELTRYARLCSNVFAYTRIKQQFFTRLVNRGYSRRWLHAIFKRHRWTSRWKLRNVRKYSPILPFVVRYSKRHNFTLVEKLFKTKAHEFDDYFENPKLMLVYSRSANISDLITSSALTRQQINILKVQDR